MKLESITNPEFLKDMDYQELESLSKEIRTFLIENIAKTGGHLSSNLGVVELTIAILRNFDIPKDKLIFDVGHQSYTYKILTGRAKDFKTLRQYNGLSGFQKRKESKYDCYEAGHSSTSLSAALGFALARDRRDGNNHVIAVIGDGSISNGLAYEALNHIGSSNTRLIVILNDNEMSISKNVGAVHNFLDKIRSTKKYQNTMQDTKSFLNSIPIVGKFIYKIMKYIKESFKKIYMKDGYLFEEFGLNYYGPINGHDFKELDKYLKMAKEENQPILLHVITKKGRGYKYAEEDVDGIYHGVAPFNVKTGKVIKKITDKLCWSEVISKNLIKLARVDKDIIAITPAMANGSKLNSFKEEFPDRFIDVGIAEEHALVLANSMSLEGDKPFVSIYSTFLQRGYDEVEHDIARMNGHVVIGVDRAGIVGEDGETHQGIYDISFLSSIPNIVIMAPSNSMEAGNMLYTAFIKHRPTAIRYSKGTIKYNDIKKYELIDIGTWRVFGKSNIYLVSYGDFFNKAINIQKKLKKKKIDLTVIDARFIKPMDTSILDEIIENGKYLFVYEESSLIGSLGSMISTYMVKHNSKVPTKLFAIPDEFVEQGTRDEIIEKIHLDEKNISEEIERCVTNVNRSKKG